MCLDLSSDYKSSQKLMAELLRRGATLLQEPCPECGGILLRYNGEDICPSCKNITSLDELEVRLKQERVKPNRHMEITIKVLNEIIERISKEKDLVKQMQLLTNAKACLELIKLLKEI